MKMSIITVTHNSVLTLNDCITSVRNQKYNDIEHIIIDGASKDGTLSLLNSKSEGFAAVISEPDKGIYDAMNKGINVSTGEIIGFLNSDDFYVNNDVISKVIREFKNDSKLEACYADLIYVDSFNTSKTIRYLKSGSFKPGLFSKGWCPPHPTFFVRRSVYESFGKFDLSFHLASDFDLMMRFLEIKKIKTHYIPEVLVKMRTGGASNRNFSNIWLQNIEILRSFDKNRISINQISFFLYKIISRLLQFFKNHPK